MTNKPKQTRLNGLYQAYLAKDEQRYRLLKKRLLGLVQELTAAHHPPLDTAVKSTDT